ncbi:MAG: hypothetical protein DRO88_09975 [Promethearchaeia archaeon]|nr:MAG: hypothetical protein DRO88_09975 [Candidatus Lokiarchaeia archaeon]
MPKIYHLRRKEKKITENSEIEKIFLDQKVFTLAMCKNNIPYLVTMDYVWDSSEKCFYFHCAAAGKKIDILNSNSNIWGQIVEDLGYIPGECDHAYRSVHFEGKVEFIDEIAIKRKALELMIKKFENDPQPLYERFLQEKSLKSVKIGKISPKYLTGKKYQKTSPK